MSDRTASLRRQATSTSVAIGQLRDDPAVVAVDPLQDSLTGLLLDVGGFGVEPPGLTINDRYWDLVLAE